MTMLVLLMMASGSDGPVVSLAGPYSVFGAGFGLSTASFSLTNTGIIASNGNPDGFWIVPQSGMGEYQARATLLSGALTSGTLNSWLSLGTTRIWEITTSNPDLSEAELLIEIRRTSDNAVLASATVFLTASAETHLPYLPQEPPYGA